MASKPGRPPTSGTRRGKGAGWGGAAKGPGSGSPGIHEAPELRLTGAQPRDPEVKRVAALKAASREVRIAALKDVLLEIAIEGENDHARIAAANAYLDREEGKPVQRQVTADLDDAKLVINVMTKFGGAGE